MNQIYETFTGKTNVDGSYKKDYIYVSPENKVYRFSDDDPKGKELISSMQNIAGMGKPQRLSPTDVSQFYTEPLPDDATPLVQSATSNAKMQKFSIEQAAADAEVERLKNQTSLGKVTENIGSVVSDPLSIPAKAFNEVKSWFGAKNRPNVPDKPTASIGGQTQGNEVIAQGEGFFRNRV